MRIPKIRAFFGLSLGILFLACAPPGFADPGLRPSPNECRNELLHRSVTENAYYQGDIGATNDRTWDMYKRALAMRWTDWNGKKLIIDIGAGQGLAMREAIESGDFERAIAIDFHDPWDSWHWLTADTRTLHRIFHEQGPAENLLPKFDSQADVIVDNYGAFTYSSARLHLLESAFRALRPGGRAYFRTPPVAFVKNPDDSLTPLGRYLERKHPKFFSVRATETSRQPLNIDQQMVGATEVLVLLRSKSASFPALNLKLVNENVWSHPREPKMKFPVVTYSEGP